VIEHTKTVTTHSIISFIHAKHAELYAHTLSEIF
jgi:hypothetical protein